MFVVRDQTCVYMLKYSFIFNLNEIRAETINRSISELIHGKVFMSILSQQVVKLDWFQPLVSVVLSEGNLNLFGF